MSCRNAADARSATVQRAIEEEPSMAIQRRETKSGTVRWIARWRDKGGREHSRSFSKRADAKAFLAEIDTRHARGADTPRFIA